MADEVKDGMASTMHTDQVALETGRGKGAALKLQIGAQKMPIDVNVDNTKRLMIEPRSLGCSRRRFGGRCRSSLKVIEAPVIDEKDEENQ